MLLLGAFQLQAGSLSFYNEMCRKNCSNSAYSDTLCEREKRKYCDLSKYLNEKQNGVHTFIDLLKRTCKSGNGLSCYRASDIYLTEEDNENLYNIYSKKACKFNYFRGCISVVITESYNKSYIPYAEKALEIAISEKNKENILAVLNILKIGSEKGEQYHIVERAMQELYNFPESNSRGITSLVTRGLFKYGNYKYNELAIRLLKNLCTNNNIKADCARLGYKYSSGTHVSQDLDLGIKYYKYACTLGDKESCNFVNKATPLLKYRNQLLSCEKEKNSRACLKNLKNPGTGY